MFATRSSSERRSSSKVAASFRSHQRDVSNTAGSLLRRFRTTTTPMSRYVHQATAARSHLGARASPWARARDASARAHRTSSGTRNSPIGCAKPRNTGPTSRMKITLGADPDTACRCFSRPRGFTPMKGDAPVQAIRPLSLQGLYRYRNAHWL